MAALLCTFELLSDLENSFVRRTDTTFQKHLFLEQGAILPNRYFGVLRLKYWLSLRVLVLLVLVPLQYSLHTSESKVALYSLSECCA